jgi:hypothetical protein
MGKTSVTYNTMFFRLAFQYVILDIVASRFVRLLLEYLALFVLYCTHQSDVT